jgi:hypothetical protein
MRKKTRNIILKSITWFFVILALLSACTDCEKWWIPFTVFCLSMLWLIPFGFANGFLKREGVR